MTETRDTAKLRRVRAAGVIGLDDALAGFDPRGGRTPGAALDVGPQHSSPALYPHKSGGRPVIGCKLWEHDADVRTLAAKLAGFAAEHQAELVLIGGDDTRGMERFGFRLERVHGEGETRDRQVAQLRDFWRIAFFV